MKIYEFPQPPGTRHASSSNLSNFLAVTGILTACSGTVLSVATYLLNNYGGYGIDYKWGIGASLVLSPLTYSLCKAGSRN